MSEVKAIVAEYEVCKAKSEPLALAIIVHVEGSSYRRPGARMLITGSGKLTGAISGGCLESDITRKALLVIHKGLPLTARYDTRNEEELEGDDTNDIIEKNPGCEGIITILLMPIDFQDNQNPVELIKTVLKSRMSFVFCSIFALKKNGDHNKRAHILLGSEDVLKNEGNVVKQVLSEWLPSSLSPVTADKIIDNARRCAVEDTHQWILPAEQNSNFGIFIEYVNPVPHLIIVGSGPDAIPLANIAEQMGWEVTLTDSKARLNAINQFSGGCQFVSGDSLQVIHSLRPDHETCIVLLTHNYHYDKMLLPSLIQMDAMYIGMIGPKTKRERILQELKLQGFSFTKEELEKLHCPAGIDIGAESPQEIALSILAEILAKRTNRRVPHLKNKELRIH